MNVKVLIKNQTRQKIQNIEQYIQELMSILKLSNSDEISILICGDTLMKHLNTTYRKKTKTTDVLSFPAEIPGFLGDIVISLPQAKKQAQQGLGKELEMLLCHGLLHLLGYDHEKSKKDYQTMMDLQNQLLKLKTTELILL